MKKYFLGILSSVFVVAALVGFRDQIGRVWAAPDRVEGVEKKVGEYQTVQEQLADISMRQQTQLELQAVELKHTKEVNELQIEALKELVKVSKKI